MKHAALERERDAGQTEQPQPRRWLAGFCNRRRKIRVQPVGPEAAGLGAARPKARNIVKFKAFAEVPRQRAAPAASGTVSHP